MSSGAEALRRQVLELTDLARQLTSGTELAAAPETVRQRVSGPLRVVIAGRANAGKSTLLNALVGERLAQTDAGECTRIFTWYMGGLGYDVRARLNDGSSQALQFRREQQHLSISLGGLSAGDVDRLEVEWPTAKLDRLTLIDTPGLGSVRGGASSSQLGTVHRGYADAVIYLMRHAHRLDSDFLEAFRDPSVADVSPINAVAVLSRADEVGSARLTALDSAATITRRYSADPQIRRLVFAVLPVAGLLAETGRTLRESEVIPLRTLAAMDPALLSKILLSVQHFVEPDRAPVPAEVRQALLLRMGLFGVRTVLSELRSGQIHDGSEISRRLIALSGLDQLQTIIDDHFMRRSGILKSRSALFALRRLALALRAVDGTRASQLERAVERVAADSHVLAEVRLLHMLLAGIVNFQPNERMEVERLTASGSGAVKVGLEEGSPVQSVRASALAGVERWRTRGASPLLDRRTAEACEIVARSYEGVYAGNSS